MLCVRGMNLAEKIYRIPGTVVHKEKVKLDILGLHSQVNCPLLTGEGFQIYERNTLGCLHSSMLLTVVVSQSQEVSLFRLRRFQEFVIKKLWGFYTAQCC